MSKYLPDFRVGDSYNLKLTITDTLGQPIDITGYKFWFTLKSSFDLADANAELQYSTVAGDNADDDVVNGICHITVLASQTKLVPVGRYYYDIQQQVGTSIVTILPTVEDYKDRITVVPEVTVGV